MRPQTVPLHWPLKRKSLLPHTRWWTLALSRPKRRKPPSCLPKPWPKKKKPRWPTRKLKRATKLLLSPKCKLLKMRRAPLIWGIAGAKPRLKLQPFA